MEVEELCFRYEETEDYGLVYFYEGDGVGEKGGRQHMSILLVYIVFEMCAYLGCE